MVVGQMLEDWVADSGEDFLGHDDAWVLDSGEDLGADLSQENHCGVLVVFEELVFLRAVILETA